MKKIALFILFLLAFVIGSTGCIFEDVGDEPTAVAVCVGLGVCLVLYCAKCMFQAAFDADVEDELAERLSKREGFES